LGWCKIYNDCDAQYRRPSPYPCTLQVTTLSQYKSAKGRLGKPHKVSKLVQIVDKATKNFVTVGEEIANENPEFQVLLLQMP